MRGAPDDSRVFHVRVEASDISRTPIAARTAAGAPVVLTNPGDTFGGVTVALGDRVLLDSQVDPAERGVFQWNGPNTPLTRASDADQGAELSEAFVQVAQGTHAGIWYQALQISTVGLDAQSWQRAVRKFRTEVWIEDDAGPASRIAAMQTTTRPMSLLAPNFAPKLRDEATMYGVSNRLPLQNVQVGFTTSQRTTDQEVVINDFFATSLR